MVGRKIERREEKARGSSGQGSISGYDTVRTPPFQYNSYHPTLAIKIRAHIPGLENLVLPRVAGSSKGQVRVAWLCR